MAAFDDYITLTQDVKIVNDKLKKTLLVTIGGLEFRKIVNTFILADENFETLIAAIKKFVRPLKKLVLERYKFFKLEREPGEDLSSFVVRLRNCANVCEFQNNDIFDVFFELRQGRIVSDTARAEDVTDSAASADLTRKVRALQQTELFSGLNRRELRLLAFGARWYEASAGEYVFRKDDDPTDGAYMILEGEAGLYLPKDGAADQLISQVGPGRLVGELGLIRNVPRALDMKAETDLKCLRIGAEEFLAVVENDSATSFKLLQVVAGYTS